MFCLVMDLRRLDLVEGWMANLYELQDIIWDELGEGDDHLVPRPGNRHGDQGLSENQSRKRTHAAIHRPAASNADVVAPSNIYRNTEDGSRISSKEREDLQNGLWTNSYDGISRDGDSSNGVFSAGSDGITNSLMNSVTDGLHEDNPILGDQRTAMKENLYQYSLNQAASAESDLNLFNSDYRDKENTDLSFYDWPNIENFEDVDRMFRSCDSTFGLGTDSENDLGWFSSVQAADGSDDTLRSNSKFQVSDAEIVSSTTMIRATSSHYNSSPLVNDRDKKPVSRRARTKKPVADIPPISIHSSLANVSDVISHIDKGKQVKQQKSSEGKKHEDKSRASVYRKESSYASKRLQPVHSFNNFSLQSFANSGVRKKGPLHQVRTSQPTELMAQTTYSNSVPFRENGAEVHSKLDGYTTGNQVELESSNPQESFSISSTVDEHSLEAISFRQLQHVLEKLDSRTKLCIRDSLYRLARSAEQRDTCGNSTFGSNHHHKDASLLTSDGTNKSTGLMDVETDTNPIDRSIAHLLFHRPSAPSVVPALGLSPRSKVHTPGSNHRRTVEERGGGAENNIAAADPMSDQLHRTT
ncbi:LNK1-like protein [Drosera capensis]